MAAADPALLGLVADDAPVRGEVSDERRLAFISSENQLLIVAHDPLQHEDLVLVWVLDSKVRISEPLVLENLPRLDGLTVSLAQVLLFSIGPSVAFLEDELEVADVV